MFIRKHLYPTWGPQQVSCYTMLTTPGLTNSEEIENVLCQTTAELDSFTYTGSPASMAVGMVPAISVTLMIAMEVATQFNQYDTNMTWYGETSCGIINKIISCRDVFKEMKSLQI